MELELKHLAPYLPYGLRIKNKTTTMPLSGYYLDELEDPQFGFDDTYKPILRPLDLTKEIEVNGEKFVPIDYLNNNGWLLDEFDLIRYNQLDYGVVTKLVEWHFDVFGLIPQGLAIDINTLNK
ncbi:MAG: hypothetical protein COA36_16885 [Desulfotalea sp.]|nr:MAG: hypothetical protein COA36_16885 [Desulfotalea sp.]